MIPLDEMNISTDFYDGPLGLLLLLIQREEMTIRKLNINHITEQYLIYLSQCHHLNFDSAGEYLYLAATLLYLKSQDGLEENNLGPVHTESDDEESAGRLQIKNRMDLVERLEKLQKFQQLSRLLWSREKLFCETFGVHKGQRKSLSSSLLLPMNGQIFVQAYIDFLSKQKRSSLVVVKDNYSIKDKLIEIQDYLQQGSRVTLQDLLNNLIEQKIVNQRKHKILTFISLLELAKLKKVQLFQNHFEQDIYVDVIDSLVGLDLSMIDQDEHQLPPETANLA
jgi:segregation and condensation protein A